MNKIFKILTILAITLIVIGFTLFIYMMMSLYRFRECHKIDFNNTSCERYKNY